MNITEAIKSLRPNSSFGVIGDRIKWNDPDNEQPTDAEINAEMKRLQAEYDSQEYARKRAEAYPPIGDQLDALYHAGVFPTDMATKIKKVKDDNPKG